MNSNSVGMSSKSVGMTSNSVSMSSNSDGMTSNHYGPLTLFGKNGTIFFQIWKNMVPFFSK